MFSLIVKIDTNNLIGDSQRNCMPWEDIELEPWIKNANRADMKRFVQLRKWEYSDDTKNIVIMWRKTRESVPAKYKPFGDNINYIISGTMSDAGLWDTKGETVQIFSSILDCLTHISEHYNDRAVSVIGGGQIYHYFLEHNLIDTIYLTRLYAKFDGDVYFPVLWDERITSDKVDFDHHSFITYHKSK